MASPQTHERRILALEARLAELHRGSVRTHLKIARIMAHLGIADVSDEDVDAALDES